MHVYVVLCVAHPEEGSLKVLVLQLSLVKLLCGICVSAVLYLHYVHLPVLRRHRLRRPAALFASH